MAALRVAIAPGDENARHPQPGGGVDIIGMIADHHRLFNPHRRQRCPQMPRVRFAVGRGIAAGDHQDRRVEAFQKELAAKNKEAMDRTSRRRLQNDGANNNEDDDNKGYNYHAHPLHTKTLPSALRTPRSPLCSFQSS